MTEPPFGSFPLPVWGRALAAACRRIPAQGAGKRLAFALRKPVVVAGQSPVDAVVAGARFRLYPQDNLSDKRLLCTPDLLDGRERGLLARRLAPGDWLVDVGANIGGYALLLAAARPDLRVVAVEADPEMVDRLQANLAFSGFQQRVQVVNAAVTRAPGSFELRRDAVNRGKSAVITAARPAGSPEDGIAVAGRPLLEVMDHCGVERAGAIKLDIEGHEFEVLAGFFEQAPRRRWPGLIQLEQHRREPLNAAVRLTLEQGYRPCLRTRMNVVLEAAEDPLRVSVQ